MAIARIVELQDGKIEIDGQEISKVNMKLLRESITMIPQEPTLFTGSLRFNLDPFNKYTDERLTGLIKQAGLDYLLDGTSRKEQEDSKNQELDQKEKRENVAFENGSDEGINSS